MSTINEIINQTKDDIFDRTISELAKEANEKYVALTSGNQSSGGILKFERNHDVVNVSGIFLLIKKTDTSVLMKQVDTLLNGQNQQHPVNPGKMVAIQNPRRF